MFIITNTNNSKMQACTLEDIIVEPSLNKGEFQLKNTNIKREPDQYGYHGQVLTRSSDRDYLKAVMLKLISCAARGAAFVLMEDVIAEVKKETEDAHSDM